MAAVAHQHHPVVVADLVAEVAEHGAVGLAELVADPLAVGVVGLGQVDGDEAVLVAGGHVVEPTGQQVEGEAVLGLREAHDGKAEVEQLGDQPALRRLGLHERTRGPRRRRRAVGCG